MIILLLLSIHIVTASDLVTYQNTFEYLQNMPCNIPVLENMPDEFTTPFILRPPIHTNEKFKKEVSIEKLLKNHGTRISGVDYPGPRAPPTPAWRKMQLQDYIYNYVMHNLSFSEYLQNNERAALLWGPSDHCDKMGNCPKDDCDPNNPSNCIERMGVHNFIPEDVVNLFDCYGSEINSNFNIGLAGKYGGINFHRHEKVWNQLIYGKKLWLLYPPNLKLAGENKTSIQMLHTMVHEYMSDPEFQKPQSCIQQEGDFIFIPDEYWHMTFNFETVFMVGCFYSY